MRIKKGFWKGISGTIEHIVILNITESYHQTSKKQTRSNYCYSIDLKNAFGEVDHRLMLKVLEHQHLPPEIKTLITGYNDDYPISVDTDITQPYQ